MYRNVKMSKYDEKEKASPVQGEVGLRSKLGGVEKSKTIPQSAMLTAPFTQGSL